MKREKSKMTPTGLVLLFSFFFLHSSFVLFPQFHFKFFGKIAVTAAVHIRNTVGDFVVQS
jgi:hypothetical protein